MRRFTNNNLKLVLAIGAFLFSLAFQANAETTCRDIYDRRWPGLEECTAKIDLDTLEASAPKSQQRSLWCWAASLSMIFSEQGHPISQDSIVLQNFGSFPNAPGGDFITFQTRLTRDYKDDNGDVFSATVTRIWTVQDAADALDEDIPILYTTSNHATVQTELKYQQAPGGPMVFKGGKIWDPWPGKSWRSLNFDDVQRYAAAWSIEVN